MNMRRTGCFRMRNLFAVRFLSSIVVLTHVKEFQVTGSRQNLSLLSRKGLET